MGKLLLRWILLAFSVFAASLVSQAIGLGFKVKYHEVSDLLPLLIGVAVLSFFNATLGWKGFLAALVTSVIIAFINGVLGVFLPDDKDDD